MHYSHCSLEWTSVFTEKVADNARVCQGINGKTSINLWSTCSAGLWNSKISLFNLQSAKKLDWLSWCCACIALISKEFSTLTKQLCSLWSQVNYRAGRGQGIKTKVILGLDHWCFPTILHKMHSHDWVVRRIISRLILSSSEMGAQVLLLELHLTSCLIYPTP